MSSTNQNQIRFRINPAVIRSIARVRSTLEADDERDNLRAEEAIRVVFMEAFIATPVMGDWPTRGGSTGEKFVWAHIQGGGDEHILLKQLVSFIGHLDGRDVSRYFCGFRQKRKIKLSALQEDCGKSRAWLRELLAIQRISPTVSDLIDSSDHWPTLENLVHVSRAKTLEEQEDRWK